MIKFSIYYSLNIFSLDARLIYHMNRFFEHIYAPRLRSSKPRNLENKNNPLPARILLQTPPTI